MVGFGCPRRDVPYPYRLTQGTITPNAAIPLCAMVTIQEPVTIAEAVARGLDWSLECAKKLGLYEAPDDGRHPLARVDATGARRAYLHALDCDTCSHRGVAHCATFEAIAKREIPMHADVRVAELVA